MIVQNFNTIKYKVIIMPRQKKNDKQKAKKNIKRLEKIEDGYLNLIVNTLESFKREKKANIKHLDNIENLLEAYMKELEYIDQRNKVIHDNILKLMENKTSLNDEIREDLKKTDEYIQSIQRKI